MKHWSLTTLREKLLSPSSQEVFGEALKAGYRETLAEAGALIEHSTCGQIDARQMPSMV